MKVLVIGTGGREHALALCLSRDPTSRRSTPHRATPASLPVATLHDVDPLDGDAVATLAEKVDADLVVIGPEAPLVAGVADAVRDRGISCFGPSRAAAELEGSKAFAKDVMAGRRRAHRRGARLHHARGGGRVPSTRSARRTSSRTTASPPARASW